MNPGFAWPSPSFGLDRLSPRELDAKESNLEAIALYPLARQVFLEHNFVTPRKKSGSLEAISILEWLKGGAILSKRGRVSALRLRTGHKTI
jgi:hypothetical protein